MPPGSVQCQIQVMNSHTRGQGIYVRLVVKQWDERLMKYSFAFQKALLTEVVKFEPKAVSWLHGVAWQLEVASSCPLTVLTNPEFWQAPAAAVVADGVDPLQHHSDACKCGAGGSGGTCSASSGAPQCPNFLLLLRFQPSLCWNQSNPSSPRQRCSICQPPHKTIRARSGKALCDTRQRTGYR